MRPIYKALRRHNLWVFTTVLLPLIFFWKIFLGLVPLPADLLAAAYLPWTDYERVTAQNPIVSDSISFIYPHRLLSIDLLKAQIAPLWNPYVLSGTPLAANFQSAPFSPTNIFYFVTDHLTAWTAQVVIQHVIAMLAMYLLLRHFRVTSIGSVVGAASFAFGGFVIMWSQWSVHSLVTALIPAVIMFTDLLITRGKYRYGLLLSLTLAAQIFSGYPQIVLYALASLGLLVAVRATSVRDMLVKGVAVSAFILLGLGIAAIQIFPAKELVHYSQRLVEPIDFEWVFMYPKELVAFLIPDFFGNHTTGDYWGPKNYLGTVGFIGIIPFFLALTGLFKNKSKVALYAKLLILFAVLLAFKNPISVFLWEKNFLGLQAAVFYKSLAVLVVGVAIGVGFGVDRIIKNHKWTGPLIFTSALVLAFTCFAIYRYLDLAGKPEFLVRGIPTYAVSIKNSILPLTILILLSLVLLLIKSERFKAMGVQLLLILVCAELFVFGWRFTPFSERRLVYPTTPVIDFLLSTKMKSSEPFRISEGNVMSLNLNIPYKLEFVGGYDAVYPYLQAKLLGSINSASATAKPQDRYGKLSKYDARLTDLMNVKYLLLTKGTDFDQSRYRIVFEDRSVVVLENGDALPRSFMVYDWRVQADETEVLTTLLSPDFDFRQTTMLTDSPGLEKGLTGESTVVYESYNENSSRLRVESSKPGLLVTSETFYPGWKAYVDGYPVDVLRANFAYRAIEIPQGHHVVEYAYQPESFTAGKKITLVSVIVLFAIFPVLKLVGEKILRNYT